MGYNILRTQRSEGGTKTEEGSSLKEFTAEDTTSFDASLSIRAFGIGASIESAYQKSKSSGQTTGSKHKYFYSTAESIDNEAAFGAGTTPGLHPDFRGKIDNYITHGPRLGSRYYREQDERFAFDLLGNYTFYVSWGQIGSRYSMTTSFEQDKLAAFEKKEKKFSVKASVTASFLSAGGGYSHDTQNKAATEELNSLATRKDCRIGQQEVGDDIVFKKTRNPGLIKARLSPVCDLFPDTGPTTMGHYGKTLKKRYNQLKEACYRVAKKAICFAHFPDWHDLSGKESDLKRIFSNTKQYEPCSGFYPPVFGVRPKGNNVISYLESFRDCLWRAYATRETAVSWYYEDGQCRICQRGAKCLDLERTPSDKTVVTGFLRGAKFINQMMRTSTENGRHFGYRENSFGDLPMLNTSALTDNPLPDGSLWLPRNTYPIGDHILTRNKSDSWVFEDLNVGCMARAAWTYLVLGHQPKFTEEGRAFWSQARPTDGKMYLDTKGRHPENPKDHGDDWFPHKNSALLHANLFYENRARMHLKEKIKSCSRICRNDSLCTHVHLKIETPFDKWFIDPLEETIDLKGYQELRMYPKSRPEVTPEDNYCFWWWNDCKHCEKVNFEDSEKKLDQQVFNFTDDDDWSECKTDHQAVRLDVTCDFYSFNSVPYLVALPEDNQYFGAVKDSFIFPVSKEWK